MVSYLRLSAAMAAVSLVAISSPASASLSLFTQFSGQYGLSTDGGGSTSNDYNVSAWVPAGATVVGAWLYQSNFDSGPHGVSLNGNALTFGAAVTNTDACCGLNSARANVTDIVKGVVDGGPGGQYDFDVLEASSNTDGTALVVIYADPTAPVRTIALLDGFSLVSGDTFSFQAAEGMPSGDPGFEAELRLGIGFSCCGQRSTVDVNGNLITQSAGNLDDGAQAANGSLITVGGNDDAFSPNMPSYEEDSERYNLVPYITAGDTSITVKTANASADDNIFMAAFLVSGEGRVVGPGDPTVPEPATWAMMIIGFGAVGFSMRRRRLLQSVSS